MTQKMTDAVKQITAALTAIMMFLAGLGYTFEQFNPNTIESFGVVLIALIPLAITLYGIWMNTFTKLESFQKAKEKEAQRLIDEGMFNPYEDTVVPEVQEVPVEVDVPEEAEDGADLK